MSSTRRMRPFEAYVTHLEASEEPLSLGVPIPAIPDITRLPERANRSDAFIVTVNGYPGSGKTSYLNSLDPDTKPYGTNLEIYEEFRPSGSSFIQPRSVWRWAASLGMYSLPLLICFSDEEKLRQHDNVVVWAPLRVEDPIPTMIINERGPFDILLTQYAMELVERASNGIGIEEVLELLSHPETCDMSTLRRTFDLSFLPEDITRRGERLLNVRHQAWQMLRFTDACLVFHIPYALSQERRQRRAEKRSSRIGQFVNPRWFSAMDYILPLLLHCIQNEKVWEDRGILIVNGADPREANNQKINTYLRGSVEKVYPHLLIDN